MTNIFNEKANYRGKEQKAKVLLLFAENQLQDGSIVLIRSKTPILIFNPVENVPKLTGFVPVESREKSRER